MTGRPKESNFICRLYEVNTSFSFFLSILSQSILIIISGEVGGKILNLAKGKNIRDGPLKLFWGELSSEWGGLSSKWGELFSKWDELTSECGASCLGASFLWGELSWGELSLGRVVLIPFLCTSIILLPYFLAVFGGALNVRVSIDSRVVWQNVQSLPRTSQVH